MKGIIFNLLEQVVVRHHGEDVWDELLQTSGQNGAYTSLGNYRDAELGSLVATGAKYFDQTPNEFLRWFGREAMPILAQRFPEFFAQHKDARSFILSTNNTIHVEVRKLYPGAQCPTFQFEDVNDGGLLLSYDSSRKLCALAHGLIEGAGDHFGNGATVDHLSCMHQGDDKCVLGIRFATLKAA